MEVTLKTMALAATVCHFDVVELWCEHESNYDFECKFTYATVDVQEKYKLMDCLLSAKQVIGLFCTALCF